MSARTYIVIYNPTLRIVGPFQGPLPATFFGKEWQRANGDNPCWNTIEFDGDPIARLVINVERPATARAALTSAEA